MTLSGLGCSAGSVALAVAAQDGLGADERSRHCKTLAIGVCYHRPLVGAAAAEQEEAAAWYARRAAEWTAAASHGWVPMLAGDLNAHTATLQDWPAWEEGSQRRSKDRAVDARGRLLLQFCCDIGARIVNGRVTGDEEGATTSHGVQRTARSVVDYFIVPEGYLTQVRSLCVSEEPLSDHSSLVLQLEGQAACGTLHKCSHTAGPCLMRFSRPRDSERAEAAVAALAAAAAAWLPALEAAAGDASSPAAVAAVAQQRCRMVAAACSSAGMRQAGRGGGRRSGCGAASLPAYIQERFHMPALRSQLRRVQGKPGSQAHLEARRMLLRATRLARHVERDERAQQLERQFLAEHDMAGFSQAYRGPRAELPDWVLREPEALFAHFQALLAPPSQLHSADTLPTKPPGMDLEPLMLPSDPHTTPPTPTPSASDALAALKASMDAPFTAAELLAVARHTPRRKAVVGPLAPWLLKPASQHLAPLLAAEFNAWRRVGCLPPADALSAIALVPKIATTPTQPSDFRGIAVGALPAKLYASVLESRVSEHAEAAGVHAAGQFGFRRGRSTEQAVLVLRTVVDSCRPRRRQHLQQQERRQQRQQSGGTGQLWAAFVDFQQAYDRVPRTQLWEQLERLGYGGEWLRTVRALYAAVPMAVSVPGLEGQTFSSTQGLKQGCPLSPTLFALYIADSEDRVMAAARRGEQLDLPVLAGELLPPLLYADDMALLATSAAGLQRQLQLLEEYCAERGLAVNLRKTKVMLLSGAETTEAASQLVRRARLLYAGQRLEGTDSFKYLGALFHSTQPIGESAAGARAAVARFAAAAFEGRCAELGLEAARLLLLLYHSLVGSTLSYCAAVWAPGLACTAARRPINGGSAPSAAEQQHHRTLRRLLGLPQRAPIATILAEAGELPLYITWLISAARLWRTATQAPAGSLLGLALQEARSLAAGCADERQLATAKQPWAAQLQQAMQVAGVEFSLDSRDPPQPEAVRRAALRRYQQRVATAAQQPRASQLRHYFVVVRPSCLEDGGHGTVYGGVSATC
ncbi:hypothetical protein D9Q98_002712 [Chlorella vulgaris]|uniref:Reverse transcriptase domain-containing protein n=1 Tax=Chlorella vulgaris TaxID=3077 RepID=A0A9D4YZ40_CHLVU|nr:hypothetical protein D9Q98_002712 [Chlorella vulgaris]